MDARLCQSFNNLLNTGITPWIAVGMTRTSGGFNKLGRRLDKLPWKTMNDAIQYDASLIALGFAVVFWVRWVCFKPQYRTKENFLRLVYIYVAKVHSLIFLPNGQLIATALGNNSGQGATTPDNSIWHVFILLLLGVRYCVARAIAVTLPVVMMNFIHSTYGDDQVGSHSEDVQQWMLSSGGPREVFVKLYQDVGISVHADEFVCSRSLEGLKFIGGIFKKTPYGWGHGFSAPRAMFAMSTSDKDLLPHDKWGKWMSILTLLAFEEERHRVRQHMVNYLRTCDGEYPPGVNPWIPSDFELYGFWFGWEGSPRVPEISFPDLQLLRE
jgi:hypothetical protein